VYLEGRKKKPIVVYFLLSVPVETAREARRVSMLGLGIETGILHVLGKFYKTGYIPPHEVY
jgi:hypothetical protein